MIRSPRVLAVATLSAAALALTGCTTHAGAAATVGSVRITAADLQAVVDRGLADPTAAQKLGSARADFTRQVLSRLIDKVVVDALAKDNGVTVTQQQVDARISDFASQAGGRAALDTQAAQNGISPKDLPTFVRTLAERDAIADKLLAGVTVPDSVLHTLYTQGIAQYDQVHSAHILVKTKAEADAIFARVTADPSTFAAEAKKSSIDTSNKDQGGDLGFAGRGQFVKEFEAAIFAGKPGTIVGPVHTQFGYHVIHIIEHKLTSFDAAKADLTKTALKSQRAQQITQAVTAEAAKLKVSVSPRYGVWDPVKDTVVAGPTSGVSSPQASPGAVDNGATPAATDSGATPAPTASP